MSGNHPFGKLSVLDVKRWESDEKRTYVTVSVPAELAISALLAVREYNKKLSEIEQVDCDIEVREYRTTVYFFGRNFDIVKDSMKYTDERLRAEQ